MKEGCKEEDEERKKSLVHWWVQTWPKGTSTHLPFTEWSPATLVTVCPSWPVNQDGSGLYELFFHHFFHGCNCIHPSPSSFFSLSFARSSFLCPFHQVNPHLRFFGLPFPLSNLVDLTCSLSLSFSVSLPGTDSFPSRVSLLLISWSTLPLSLLSLPSFPLVFSLSSCDALNDTRELNEKSVPSPLSGHIQWQFIFHLMGVQIWF